MSSDRLDSAERASGAMKTIARAGSRYDERAALLCVRGLVILCFSYIYLISSRARFRCFAGSWGVCPAMSAFYFEVS